MAEESGYFRGAGGVIWEMRLPLSGDMADQLTKGYLSRVNEDGTPYVPAGAASPEPEGPPGANASKAQWVGFAHRVHGISIDEAEALTKNDLMELHGAKG